VVGESLESKAFRDLTAIDTGGGPLSQLDRLGAVPP